MTHKIIIDCDPGIDDALAIFLALASPEIDLLGLTTVAGNVGQKQTFLNALRILAQAGRLDIPVLQGASRPLLAPPDLFASVHGTDGLGDLNLAIPNHTTSTQHAAQFIIDQAHAHPGQITLCPIGPMTNVALALRLDPTLAQTLKQIVFMGGAAFCPGNMNDWAEFNLLVDPHAAQIVLQSGAKCTMFGLDATQQALITPARIAALQTTSSTCARLAARLLQGYSAGDLHLHDPCVLAHLIDPSLFSGPQCDVQITTHGPEFGRSVATPTPNGPCQVITQVDTERLFTLLTTRLATLP